jgi:hypothetical protein
MNPTFAAILSYLDGKKTYLVSFLAVAYLGFCKYTHAAVDSDVLAAFGFGAAATFRSALAKLIAQISGSAVPPVTATPAATPSAPQVSAPVATTATTATTAPVPSAFKALPLALGLGFILALSTVPTGCASKATLERKALIGAAAFLDELSLAEHAYAKTLVVQEAQIKKTQATDPAKYAADWTALQKKELQFDAAVDHFQAAEKLAISSWAAAHDVTDGSPTAEQLLNFSNDFAIAASELAQLLGVKTPDIVQ